MTFHNGGWATLMRLVYSVLNRSPSEMLKEIVLVDYYSTKGKFRDRSFKSTSNHPQFLICVVIRDSYNPCKNYRGHRARQTNLDVSQQK